MGRYIPTPAFFTFDPIIRSPSVLLPAVLKSIDGEHRDLLELMEGEDLGLEFVEGREIGLDVGTLLFLCCAQWESGVSAPMPLVSSHSMERLGRFPSENGNAIAYLLDFVTTEDDSNLPILLKKMSEGLKRAFYEGGYDGRENGEMGILGWLDHEEVTTLRTEIESGRWSVKSEETFDGGVQDAFRHLLVFLRSAGRRNCGIMMRSHR